MFWWWWSAGGRTANSSTDLVLLSRRFNLKDRKHRSTAGVLFCAERHEVNDALLRACIALKELSEEPLAIWMLIDTEPLRTVSVQVGGGATHLQNIEKSRTGQAGYGVVPNAHRTPPSLPLFRAPTLKLSRYLNQCF
jgi:hypothetical protein